MGKHILITGASRGMGHDGALYLADQNHLVSAVARSRKPLSRLENQHENIAAYPTDLTDSGDLDRLVQNLENDQPSIDAIINGAGALVNKPFTELTSSDWDLMLDTNLRAPVDLIQKTLHLMSDDGHIVNISSMAGYQGSAKFPGLTAYSVAKGGLSILTECLAGELADQDISCNALCLGMVQTEMLEDAFPGIDAPVSSEQMGQYIGDFALNGHTFYNGQVLPVAREDPE